MKLIALIVRTVSRIVAGTAMSRPGEKVPASPKGQYSATSCTPPLVTISPLTATCPASLVTESSSKRSSRTPSRQISVQEISTQPMFVS